MDLSGSVGLIPLEVMLELTLAPPVLQLQMSLMQSFYCFTVLQLSDIRCMYAFFLRTWHIMKL